MGENELNSHGKNVILNKFYKAFPALSNKNYRLYFVGQLISLIGSWLQMVALGWLVLELTHSAFLVGLTATLGTLPVLFFALFGGVIVDRFDKKKILILTQSFLMVFALILGVLTVTGLINVYEIYILAFLSGLVSALDSPARQSFVIEMVGKEKLQSAIALNSGTFNGARVMGPAVAGFIIAFFGVGGAFILNAISFIAVIIALLLINAKSLQSRAHDHPLKAIKEGLSYSYHHPIIKNLLIFAGITSIFGWSYTFMMPYIIQNTFHMNESSLGYFYTPTGVGAVIGTIIVSMYAKKVNPFVFIIFGSFISSISLIFFALTSNFIIALIFLFLSGLGILMQFSTINTTLQHIVSDHIRGRVMSIYALMFIGMMPIGSFQIGALSERFGTSFAIIFGSVIIFLYSVYLFYNKGNLQKELQKHL